MAFKFIPTDRSEWTVVTETELSHPLFGTVSIAPWPIKERDRSIAVLYRNDEPFGLALTSTETVQDMGVRLLKQGVHK